MPLDQLIPRGPTFLDENDPTADYADRYLQRMSHYREAIRTEAVRSLKASPEYPNVGRYMDYLKGNHRDPRLERYRSKFFVNKIDQARYDNLALLTDSQPSISVTSTVDDKEYKQSAEIAENVIRAEWTRQRMDLALVRIVDIAYLWGTGFAKVQAATPGTMSLMACGPDQVFPIQPGWDLQDSMAVMYRIWKPLSYFKQKYPFSSYGIEKQISALSFGGGLGANKPGWIDNTTWNSMAPQMKRMLGSTMPNSPTASDDNRQYFGSIELQEIYLEDYSVNESNVTVVMKDQYLPLSMHNWWYKVRPGERLYPRKRLIVFGGTQLVYDGPSPYWHGKYPFACLRLRPTTWSFYGHSEYRNQIPIQDAINDIGAGIMDMQKRILNPVLITTESAVSKAAWDMFLQNKPGAKLMVHPNQDVDKVVRYAENPEVPGWILQVMTEWLDPQFDKMAGTLDTASLLNKEQTPGGDTIEQMKDNLQTANRLRERYLEAFLTEAGIQGVSNVFQFYTKRQRLRILGSNGITMSDFDYRPENLVPASQRDESFWKNFAMGITPGSLRGNAQDRKKLLAISLWNSKALDLKTLHEILQLDDPDLIIERMMMQAQIQSGMAGGAPPPGEGGAPGQETGPSPRLSREERNGSETV